MNPTGPSSTSNSNLKITSKTAAAARRMDTLKASKTVDVHPPTHSSAIDVFGKVNNNPVRKTKQSDVRCPFCLGDFHLKFMCPTIRGGSDSIRKRLGELAEESSSEEVISELQGYLDKAEAQNAKKDGVDIAKKDDDDDEEEEEEEELEPRPRLRPRSCSPDEDQGIFTGHDAGEMPLFFPETSQVQSSNADRVENNADDESQELVVARSTSSSKDDSVDLPVPMPKDLRSTRADSQPSLGPYRRQTEIDGGDDDDDGDRRDGDNSDSNA